MAYKLMLVVDSVLIICYGRCSSFLSMERLGFCAYLDMVEVIIT